MPIVQPLHALSPMETWRQTHFGTTANAGSAADSADPDGDGVPNIWEALYGTPPNVATTGHAITKESFPDGPSLLFEKMKSFSDVDIVVQASPDLAHWTSGAETVSTALVQDLGAKARYRGTLTAPVPSRAFLRLLPARPSQGWLTSTLVAQSNSPDTMLSRCLLPTGDAATAPFSGAINAYPDNDAAAEPWLDWYFCNIGLCAFVASHPSQVKAYIQRYLDYVDELDAQPGWNHRIKRLNLSADKRTPKAGTVQASDSDDAYASTLVRLACLFRKANPGEDAWFIARLPKLKNLMYANVVTQARGNGLIRAKQEGYDIAFLEDNVENWAGLKELVDALVATGDTTSEIEYYTGWRDAVRDAIHSQLWDATGQHWKTHDAAPSNTPAFIEDFHCQIFPELYDLPHPSGPTETQRRYDAAWTYFSQRVPQWWTDVWSGEPFSHLDIAVVASKRGETDRARGYLEVALGRWIPVGDDPRGTVISEIGYWKRLLSEP